MSESTKATIHDPTAARAFLEEFPTGVASRGTRLYAAGAVRHVEDEEDGLGFSVKVQANRVCVVSLFHTEGAWDAECSCPSQFDCEHAYAAMTALLAGQRATAPSEPNAAPGSELERRVLGKPKRKLSPGDRAILTKVQELFQRSRNKGGIESWEMNQLGFFVHGYGWGVVELWPSPPRNDYEFWLYVAYDLARRKVQIPP